MRTLAGILAYLAVLLGLLLLIKRMLRRTFLARRKSIKRCDLPRAMRKKGKGR